MAKYNSAIITDFMSLGWWTVPLGGKIERKADGSKTIPKFEQNWKDIYAQAKNKVKTKLAGVMTGEKSGIIAIDCDNKAAYDLFTSLDPTYKFHFVSTKPKIGGTIIYKYSAKVGTFSVANDCLKLDCYSTGGFIYLPGEHNTAKEPFNKALLSTLAEAPSTIIALLVSLNSVKGKPTIEVSTEGPKKYENHLASKAQAMLLTGKFLPSFFSQLTPKSFRQQEEYLNCGYLHPDNVPEGLGSEYLSKVSAILGKDISINEDLYLEVMTFVNNLWSNPMPAKQLEKTLLEPMLNGSATIDGEKIWQYDKYWEDDSLSLVTKAGENLDLFFDDAKGLYYVINNAAGNIKTYDKSHSLSNYLSPTLVGMPKITKLIDQCPLIRTCEMPAKEYGFYQKDSYTKVFNLFKQTQELAILNTPDGYSKLYKKPVNTLAYFESLIPHKDTRDYLLSFIKYKLTSFSYSPVILYFLGISGSGKDTFVNLLAKIIGEPAVVRPSSKEFLSNFNGWLVGAQFVQLDEYGDQLKTFAEKDVALGLIKSYTGKPAVQIRQMRQDGYNYKHSATFVMTANSSPLMLEANDRRILYIDTPDKLENAPWVKKLNGTNIAIGLIMGEAKDFCYYLATEVKELSASEYQKPLETSSKIKAIAEDLSALEKLVYLMKNCMVEELADLAEDNFMPETTVININHKFIFHDDLTQLYLSMTDSKGKPRMLSKRLTKIGIKKEPTTKGGKKIYRYILGRKEVKECRDRRVEREDWWSDE